MRQLNIPKFFHELFGSKQYFSEILIVLAFTLLATLTTAWLNREYWLSFSLWRQLVLLLLYLDITGGVLANLSYGTNDHYNQHARARWVFIAIHIQPLLLAWTLNASIYYALCVWLYTITCASIINSLRHRLDHRILAGFFMTSGLIALFMTSHVIPKTLLIIYGLYMIKVIYSFAVNHHLEVKNEDPSK